MMHGPPLIKEKNSCFMSIPASLHIFSSHWFIPYSVTQACVIISAMTNETEVPEPAPTCPADGTCEYNISAHHYQKGNNPEILQFQSGILS